MDTAESSNDQTELATSSNEEVAIETEKEIDASKIWYMEVDTRIYQWVWSDDVTRSEIIEALETDFNDDVTKIIKPIRFKKGLFKIIADDFTPYLNKTIVIRGKEIQLIPRMKRELRQSSYFAPEKREGTYVTIYDAYDPEYRSIDHEAFDEHFASIEGVEILVQTQPQRDKKFRTSLTGHRFLVVKHIDADGNKIDLGSCVRLQGCRFNLKYDGMTSYCYLCAMKHGKECPRRVRNEFLQKLRAEKTNKRKIYSDSTLRQTNQVALTTDVACMPGGGIGQLCNAITLDKKTRRDRYPCR